MNEQGSYGTGRAPEKKPSHTSMIVLLLLAFAATHLLPYLSSISARASQEQSEALYLPEQRHSDADTPLSDGYGFGLTLAELTEPQRKYWSLPSGVFIEQIDKNGIAYAAGLRAGDVIVRVGQADVENTEAFQRAFAQHATAETLSLIYYREGQQYTALIPLTAKS